MVLWSDFRMWQYRDGDPREDALHFKWARCLPLLRAFQTMPQAPSPTVSSISYLSNRVIRHCAVRESLFCIFQTDFKISSFSTHQQQSRTFASLKNSVTEKVIDKNGHFKGSPDQTHFIFEINVGEGRIRHRRTQESNFQIDSKTTEDDIIESRFVLCRIRLFPTLISKIKWLGSELPLKLTPFSQFKCRKRRCQSGR